jgi:hypothetical protein
MNRNHPMDSSPSYHYYYPLVVCGKRQQLDKIELKLQSLRYKTTCCFKHKNRKSLSISSEPFTNLISVTCFQIPQEPNIKKALLERM